jgi:hypothetical protein
MLARHSLFYDRKSRDERQHSGTVSSTLKGRMCKYFCGNKTQKYITVLKDFVTAYNDSKQRSIGRAPKDVNEDNEGIIWETLRGKSKTKKKPTTTTAKHQNKFKPCKFTVQIGKTKRTFVKG